MPETPRDKNSDYAAAIRRVSVFAGASIVGMGGFGLAGVISFASGRYMAGASFIAFASASALIANGFVEAKKKLLRNARESGEAPSYPKRQASSPVPRIPFNHQPL